MTNCFRVFGPWDVLLLSFIKFWGLNFFEDFLGNHEDESYPNLLDTLKPLVKSPKVKHGYLSELSNLRSQNVMLGGNGRLKYRLSVIFSRYYTT